MTEEEFEDWTTFNRRAKLHSAPSTPCEDCTAAYSAEMRALNLCVGFPGPQRYCSRCLRWWPDDKRYWASWSAKAGHSCLRCRQHDQSARWYRRLRADPLRYAVRKDRATQRARVKYQTNPTYRAMILARNRAARTKS